MIVLPLDGVTDAVVILDREWRYVHVNEKAGALLGRAPATLVGRHVWTELPDAVGDAFRPAFERVMATRVETRFEAYVAPWDRWFEHRVFPTPDGILVLFTETTEARRAQQALERSERRFHALIEATQLLAWWIDATGAIVEPLPQWLALTGQTAEEAAGYGWVAAVHPDDRSGLTDLLRVDARPQMLEYRLRRHDGVWRRVVSRAIPLQDANGAVVEWVGTLTDVTDERDAEAALVASEARFRSLSVSSPVGIFTADATGSVTYVNPRATEIWGTPEAELLGFGWTTRVHPADLPRVLTRWRGARAEAREHEQDYRLRLPDGSVRWVRGRSAPLRDADGREIGAVGTIEDVTAQRALEARLRQAQKLEAIGQLAGGVAHDFNNLLTVIQGNLEFATQGLPTEHAVQADLAEIAVASERARTLVRQLLAFSRQQVLAPRRVDLNAVVQAAAQLLRPLIGEEISLHVALAAGPLAVDADPGQLEQVVLNLAINARDAMLTPKHGHTGRGGALSLETDMVTLAAPDVDAWAPLGVGPYARLVVRDTGHGMDPVTASRALEPFFTTKAAGHGTGLGLASAYGVVTQSGGAMRVTSAPGAGTAIAILLPRTAGPVTESADGAAPGGGTRAASRLTGAGHAAVRHAGGTVLLVEDERSVRVATRRVLERGGFTVLDARHGADALRVWGEQRDAITAVVTDLRMPELGGEELVTALRADAPTLPVVYMSGYPDEAPPSLRHPYEAFVEKPFTAEALLDALHALLAA